jgi:hypothetical protein
MRTDKSSSCLLTLLMACLCFSSTLHAHESALNVLLNVELSRDADRLDMQLTNATGRKLQLYKSDLPWGNTYSRVLVAVKLNGTNSVISTSHPIDDPGPDTIDLAADETVAGSIPLSTEIPELEEALRKYDVLVFWSYKLKDADGKVSNRFSGMVTLKKRAPS